MIKRISMILERIRNRFKRWLELRKRLPNEEHLLFLRSINALSDLGEFFDQFTRMEGKDIYGLNAHRMQQCYDLYFLLLMETEDGFYDDYFEEYWDEYVRQERKRMGILKKE